MEWRASIDIDATPDAVWRVLGDVEAWPAWTPSVRRIVRLDPGPPHVGQRLRISQPRFPTTVWRLTELVEGRVVVWRAGGPGARATASHAIEPHAAGTRVTLSLTLRGPLGLLVGVLTGGLTRRYLELETAGLKRAAEQS
jgi:carbon monoxide dehydrogenase subunit G